mmetsp:Transcript_2182/g.3291  ORF Transcript_2182/g.3291 Transcript_2182/m.3291 type:complete len:314 (-) Transcript_2182:191-1132(-)
MNSFLLDIPLIEQKYNWDCGLICTLMLVQACGYKSTTAEDLMSACGTKSVWTIDLAHLIRRFGFSVDFFTLELGPNPAYSTEFYYASQIHEDEVRVARLFSLSSQNGILIHQRALSAEDLAEILTRRDGSAIILLVDKNKFRPQNAQTQNDSLLSTHHQAPMPECESILDPKLEMPIDNESDEAMDDKTGAFVDKRMSSSHIDSLPFSSPPRSPPVPPQKPLFPSFSPAEVMFGGWGGRGGGEGKEGGREVGYIGHYVLLIGYDGLRRDFLLRDPAVGNLNLRIGFKDLDFARKCFGTDEDILVVRHPALLHE